MAVLDRITIGNILYLVVDADPAIDGIPANTGSIATYSTGSEGNVYIKTGIADIAWTKITGIFPTGVSTAKHISSKSGAVSVSILNSYQNLGTFVLNKADHLFIDAGNNNYGTLTFNLEFVLGAASILGSSAIGNIRLFNWTTNSVISNSIVSYTVTSGNTDRILVSGSLSENDIPSGTNILEFQANITTLPLVGAINFYYQSLKIINTY